MQAIIVLNLVVTRPVAHDSYHALNAIMKVGFYTSKGQNSFAMW
jgi:hypothetical protein